MFADAGTRMQACGLTRSAIRVTGIMISRHDLAAVTVTVRIAVTVIIESSETRRAGGDPPAGRNRELEGGSDYSSHGHDSPPRQANTARPAAAECLSVAENHDTATASVISAAAAV